MNTILGVRRGRYLAILGILLTMLALIGGTAGCLFPSRSQNLEIRDWNDLNAIRNNLSGHYILMNDLNSTTAGYDELASPTANEGKGWHPIGGPGSSGDGPPFTGTFDGHGYEIRDVFINLPGIGYVGLFSVVGEGGQIDDIGIVNADVAATAYVGALVGINGGTVSNSYSTGSLTGNQLVGGLAGANTGTVTNSYSTASLTCVLSVGGLVGQNNGTVSNSYSTGNVTADSGAGGLMGTNTGTVNNSYSTGNVTANSAAGGLMAANSGTVNNSYSTGSVTGNDLLGGLIGYSDQGTVSGSFWDAETSGQVTSDGGTGMNTANMHDVVTFSAAGWNIIAVVNPVARDPSYTWNVVNGVTYPFLSWQL
jgi:hypothetical protein